MKKTLTGAFRIFGSVVCISALTICASVLPFSCSTDDGVVAGTDKALSDSAPPMLLSFKVLDSKSVKFTFSEAVTLGNVTLTDSDEKSFLVDSSCIHMSEDKTSAEIAIEGGTEVGKSYVLKSLVADSFGNTMELEQNFIGFNEKKARIVLSEVRNKPSANSSEPLKSKVEYVEFYVLDGGNLFGLELKLGYYAKSYKFPSIDVSSGERIVLHLRSYGTPSMGFVDELGSDLEKSTAQDSSSARDLWFQNTSSVITQNDVVVLVDNYTGLAVDGLMSATSGKESWSRKNQSQLASLLVSSGVWSSDSTEAAVVSDNSTAARTLSRQNLALVAEAYSKNPDAVVPVATSDWIVASKATPGEENSTLVYSK